MKKSLSLLLASAMLITAIPLHTMAADDDGTLDVSLEVTYGQTAAREMLEYINEFRTGGEAWYWNSTTTEKIETGVLPALEYSYTLEQAAMQRAAEIALSFDHTRPDGTSCYTAWNDVGTSDVDPYGYTYGENIAGGYSTAYNTYLQWREDDDDYWGQGHRRNMLNKNYKYIGIGHVVVNGTHLWVQQFGTGDPGSETEACDETTTVVIAVANDRVESFVIDEPEAITLAGGESAAVPEVTGRIKVVNYWISPKVTVVPEWTTEEGNIIFLDDGTVTGHSKGSTKLTAAVFGVDVEVPVTVTSDGHSWSKWDQTKAPTCTEKGSKTRTCSVCKEKETEDINALGHDYEAEVTDPTCTEGGYTTYVCTRCEDTYVGDETDALGHTEGEPVKENVAAETCTKGGSYEEVVYCTVCNEELSRETITVPALGHTEGKPVKENVIAETCTTDGSYDEVVYCTVCNEELSREKITVTAPGHSWDEGKETVAPTCTTKGEALYTCTVCEATKTEDIDELGHDYEAEVTDPTCTEGGYTTYVCTRCEDTYVGDETDARGHTEGKPVKENVTAETCTEGGSYEEVVYCAVCGVELSRKEVTVDALGHTEDEPVKENEVPATCTEGGSYEEVVYCAVCKVELSRKTVDVDANGHSWDEGEVTTEPTCTEEGVMTYTCTVCGETKTEAVETAAHPFKDGVCTVCGEEDPDYGKTLPVIPDSEYVEDEEAAEEALSQALEDLLSSTDPEDQELIELIKEAFNAGQTVSAELEISVIEAPDNAEEFAALLDGEIFYLDISILVKTDDGTVLGYMTETDEGFTFRIPLPESLKGKDVVVLRMHDGEIDELECTVEDDVVIFTTDKFSTYAIGVAAEEAANDSTTPGDETGNPDTGVAVEQAVLVMITLSAAAMTLLRKKRA